MGRFILTDEGKKRAFSELVAVGSEVDFTAAWLDFGSPIDLGEEQEIDQVLLNLKFTEGTSNADGRIRAAVLTSLTDTDRHVLEGSTAGTAGYVELSVDTSHDISLEFNFPGSVRYVQFQILGVTPGSPVATASANYVRGNRKVA